MMGRNEGSCGAEVVQFVDSAHNTLPRSCRGGGKRATNCRVATWPVAPRSAEPPDVKDKVCSAAGAGKALASLRSPRGETNASFRLNLPGRALATGRAGR